MSDPTLREPSRQHNQPVNNQLHPIIYKAIFGLAVWLVLSIWMLFSGGQYIGLILGVITVFLAIAVGIPTLLWRTFQRRDAQTDRAWHETYRLWASQQFRSWTGDLPGKAAAAQILLPIAAVAFGFTVIGLIYDLSIPHLS